MPIEAGGLTDAQRLERAHRLRDQWAEDRVCFGAKPGSRVEHGADYRVRSEYCDRMWQLGDAALMQPELAVKAIIKHRGPSYVLYYLKKKIKTPDALVAHLREHSPEAAAIFERGVAALPMGSFVGAWSAGIGLNKYDTANNGVEGLGDRDCKALVDAIDPEWLMNAYIGPKALADVVALANVGRADDKDPAPPEPIPVKAAADIAAPEPECQNPDIIIPLEW